MSDSALNSKSLKLATLVREVSAAKNLEEIIALVKKSAREMCGSDGITFVLRDGDKSHYVEEDAISPLWKGLKFPLETCISGWVMIHREAAVIGDIYEDPRIPYEAYRPTFVQSLAMVPIGENPMGALGAYWAEKYKPTVEDVRSLQALADAISVSIRNVQLQNALKTQIENLQSSATAKDEFLMVLSHELRTPMNAILGWVQLILENEQLPAEIKTAAEVIERNAHFQLSIIKDLLDVSQIISGRMELERDPVDISGLLHDIVKSFQPEAAKKRIALDVHFKDQARVVMGDHGRLEQIFRNIISNALKFTPKDGQVSVSIERSEGFSKIKVVDNGQGLSPEFLPFVFDRFQQADSGITRSHGGLGLGLAIVKYLAESHGGRVQVESEGLGKGSTFSVYLPVAAVAIDAESLGMEDQSKGMQGILQNARILAVDDNPDAVNLLQVIFKKYGAEVMICDSAGCAERAIIGFHPQVMICDLSMPEEDGLSLMKRMRANGCKVPAIALTAHVDRYYEAEAKKSGFDDYLTKPVNPAELLRATNAALSRVRG